MTEKTEALYNEVMQLVLTTAAEEVPGDHFSIRLMISDYEEAILNCMKTTFPDGRERGCWFHYGQVCIIYFVEFFRFLLCAFLLPARLFTVTYAKRGLEQPI